MTIEFSRVDSNHYSIDMPIILYQIRRLENGEFHIIIQSRCLYPFRPVMNNTTTILQLGWFFAIIVCYTIHIITYSQVTLTIYEPRIFTIFLQSAASASKLYTYMDVSVYGPFSGWTSLLWGIAAIWLILRSTTDQSYTSISKIINYILVRYF